MFVHVNNGYVSFILTLIRILTSNISLLGAVTYFNIFRRWNEQVT